MATGSCWCRKVQYSIGASPQSPSPSTEPLPAMLCHCLTCQRITGSAFSTCISVPKPALTVASGAQHVKAYTAKHHEVQDMDITVHFCDCCGTTLWKAADGDGLRDALIVFAGTLDGSAGAGADSQATSKAGVAGVRPQAEIWVKERAGWLTALDSVMQCDSFPTR